MRIWVLALALSAGCKGEGEETGETGAEETDDSDSSDASDSSDTSDSSDASEESDASDTSDSSDTSSGDPIFATEAPGAGTYGWTSDPTMSPNTCAWGGGRRGNGYVLSDVNTTARTFKLTPDAGGQWPVSDCTYDVNGAFTCTENVQVFNFAEFGMEGTATQRINHSGQFGSQVMTINGTPHDFGPSWAFQVNSHYAWECIAPAGNCDLAAYNGWGYPTLPCEVRIQHGTFSFNDPNSPS